MPYFLALIYLLEGLLQHSHLECDLTLVISSLPSVTISQSCSLHQLCLSFSMWLSLKFSLAALALASRSTIPWDMKLSFQSPSKFADNSLVKTALQNLNLQSVVSDLSQVAFVWQVISSQQSSWSFLCQLTRRFCLLISWFTLIVLTLFDLMLPCSRWRAAWVVSCLC